MRIVAGLCGLAALGLVAVLASEAEAAQPPRVQAYECSALAATHGTRGIWQTWFYGDRRDLFDYVTDYRASPCFTSLAACKAWLYWAQSDWPDHNNSGPCRRGIGY
jgi:hypothetical protein